MNGSLKPSFEFGEYRLIPAERLLLKAGGQIQLPPKAFDVLVVLVENAGELVDNKTMLELVWPDSFVEEANIQVQISAIRKVFDETTAGTIIETVSKRGYRFSANVTKNFNGDQVGYCKGAQNGRIEELGKSSDNAPSIASKRRRKRLVFVTAVAGLGIAVITSAAIIYVRRTPVQFRKFVISKVTTSGDITQQSISPDGRYVAYWKGGEQFFTGGKLGLFLRQIGTGREIQLASPGGGGWRPPTFSPDCKYVYYLASPDAELSSQIFLYRVPLLGGDSILMARLSDAPIPYISPDGGLIGTIGWSDSEEQTVIKIFNVDGASERILASRQAPNYYADSGPWSPDGRFIACWGKNAGEAFTSLIVISVDDGTETIIPSRKWSSLYGVSWLPDMSALVIAAKDEFSETSQIWHVTFPSGATTQITNDTNNYFWASMSSDGKSISAILRERPAQIWTIAVDPGVLSRANDKTVLDTAGAKLISSNMVDGYYGLSNVPDGKVVFTSSETGNLDIWSMNGDGAERRQLTTDRHIDFHQSVCGNGGHVVFTSNRNGGEHTWLMDLDGGNQRQLTFGHVERYPDCSLDGQWVVYNSWDSGKASIWKIPIAGGTPIQLTDTSSEVPMFSPDGSLISYQMGNKIGVIASNGGPPIKVFNAPKFVNESTDAIRWTPNGKALIISGSENGIGNLWIQPLDGELRKLTNFTSHGIWKYDWSKDGRRLLFSRGSATSDIVLLSNAE